MKVTRLGMLCLTVSLALCFARSANGRLRRGPSSSREVAAVGQTGQDSAAKPIFAPISALEWLVGGVWTADASKMGSGMQRIETRYRWADNHAFIRFTTSFVLDKGTEKAYDGNCFWDPAQKSLEMWYMDAQNQITAGPVEMSGDEMKVSFRGPDFEGKPADLRVFVRRKTNDEYRWSVEAQGQDGGWKELAWVEYLRMADR